MNSACVDPGALFEHIFFVEAMKRGLMPFLPMQPRQPQDSVVMNQAGKMYKVQVKGTHTTIVHHGAKRFKIQPVCGNVKKTPIDCTKVDLLVAYIEPEDAFYIIPCLEIENVKSLWFYTHNPNSKAKFEKYRERWDLFKN